MNPTIMIPDWNKIERTRVPSGYRVVALVKVAHRLTILIKVLIWLAIIASVLFGTYSLVTHVTQDTSNQGISDPLNDGTPPKALPLPLENSENYDHTLLPPLKEDDGKLWEK